MATVIDELEIKVNSHGLDALLATLDKVSASFKEANKASAGFQSATATVAKASASAAKATQAASVHTNKFVASIVRIAKYRAIRTALRMVTKSIKEGIESFYNFSKASGEQLYGFANAMDAVKGKSLTLSAQLGSAFAALLSAIAPIINKMIDLVIKLANALSMVFSAFGGKGTWMQAADGASALGDAIGGAGGAAKEALRYLAPFDELNVLPKESGGGGGGGGGSNPLEGISYTEQDIPEWLQNFSTSFKLTVDDVFFNFDNLNPEQIAEKAIVGITGLLGGIAGFVLGGVSGAVTGTLFGVGVGVLINTLVFNHDGKIDADEVANLVVGALGAATGGLIGGVIAGPAGALIGISLGAMLTISITELHFIEKFEDWKDQYAQEHPDSALGQWFAAENEAERVMDISLQANLDFKYDTANGFWKWLMGEGETSEAYNTAITANVEVEKAGWDTISDWLKKPAQWGEDVVKKGISLLKDGWESVSEWIKRAAQWGENTIKKGIGLFNDGWKNVSGWIYENFWGGELNKAIGLYRVASVWKNVAGWIYENFWGGELNKAIGIYRNSSVWKNVAGWIYDNHWGGELNKAIGLYKGGWSNVWNWIKQPDQWGSDIVQKRIEIIRHGWDTVYNWIKKAAQWGTDLVERAIDLKKNGWTTVTSWVQSHLGTGTVSVGVSVHSSSSAKGVKANGGVFENGAWRDINRYASGGLPMGSQLFWAREAGPELVGTLGGHTAVMNNDQIVASVSNGVAKAIAGIRFRLTSMPTYSGGGFSEESLYNAFVRALADTSETIELDGEVIYRKMLGRNRQETYRTGNNPMMAMA